MCTIALLFHEHPAADLVIAANRDEFYQRPAGGARLLREAPVAVGGIDLQAGGTWMGANEAGLFVGLTNMRSAATGRRSRGEIVHDLLASETVRESREALEDHLRRGQYRPFNLLVGTDRELLFAAVRDSGWTVDEVEPGCHVLPSNGTLDDPEQPKVRGVRRRLEALCETDEGPLSDGLKALLSSHHLPELDELPTWARESSFGANFERQLQAVCVHTPVYGTRSASLIFIRSGIARYEYCDGPPCSTPWRNVRSLFDR